MAMPSDVERDIDAIRLPRWGRVVEVDGVVPYEVQDADGQTFSGACDVAPGEPYGDCAGQRGCIQTYRAQQVWRYPRFG